jgi:energy-coupling factor transporter ATP-binding protein EcfA2
VRVDSIQLRDVGPFDDVTIEFPPGSDPTLADVYLLTGPNGTGKSTVLYSIAAAIMGTAANLGRDLAHTRLRGNDALVAVYVDDVTFCLARRPSDGGSGVIEHRGNRLWHTGSRDRVQYFRSKSPGDRPSSAAMYAQLASILDASAARGPNPSFSWAAFAYAGMRSLEDVRVTAVQTPTHNPFESSLSFFNTADTKLLANWIANQQFLRLKAKDAGRDERAAQIERSIADIEGVIAEIVDDPGFKFVSREDSNDILVRWQGVDIDLGLLPDGLKSIISWVADLLMRLDRIPWVGNTPTTQRSFLLLLDEIDIHLHPAWQRKVLPFVQKAFPNAQIIASTHSPVVVASAADAHIITLGLQGNRAFVESMKPSQTGVSYGEIMRSIFGIPSDFDLETENDFRTFHAAKDRLLAGDTSAQAEVDQLAARLAARSEELAALISLERAQLRRQLAQRSAS